MEDLLRTLVRFKQWAVMSGVVAVLAVAAVAAAQSGGDCYAGRVVGPGERCTYPGTSQDFWVDDSGQGRFGFLTFGEKVSVSNVPINGVTYDFSASKQADGTWLIEVAGTTAATTPTTTLFATTPTFSDLDAAGEHRSAVEELAARGVLEGTNCGSGEFCPRDAVERWVMAVWLVRILDGTDPAGDGVSRFADVHESQWWAPYTERLAELGVTDGCGTEPVRFCPYETVNRARMASFLVRAFGLAPAASAGFADVGDGVHTANIDALAASGVTSGCRKEPLRYCPRRDTTRAQMATLLTRAVALDSRKSVEPLAGPPSHLGLHRFYEKYLDSGGIPIVSSADVPDEALYAAKDIFTEMLADAPDLSSTMAESDVRVVIMARSTVSSDLPEFPTNRFWDERTRGGGFFDDPMVVIAEENLLCYEDDLFPYEDINVHEFAHALHLVGLKRHADSNFDTRLNAAYQRALADGLWKDTYASTNAEEYWAEGVQSWFGLNDPPGPIHNDINTREELEVYDPKLVALLGEVFGDASVSSSCHETFVDDGATAIVPTAIVQGAVRGPEGETIGRVLIWLWQGTRENSRYGWTDSDGNFTTRVPDGAYRLDVYAARDGTCAGYYDGEGITTNYQEAAIVTVEGTDIVAITIRLPARPQDLPTVRC